MASEGDLRVLMGQILDILNIETGKKGKKPPLCYSLCERESL